MSYDKQRLARARAARTAITDMARTRKTRNEERVPIVQAARIAFTAALHATSPNGTSEPDWMQLLDDVLHGINIEEARGALINATKDE